MSTILPARCNYERRKCCSKPVDCLTRIERQSRTIKNSKRNEREKERKREKHTTENENESRRKRGHVCVRNMLYKSYFFYPVLYTTKNSIFRRAPIILLFYIYIYVYVVFAKFTYKIRSLKYSPSIKLDICQTTV